MTSALDTVNIYIAPIFILVVIQIDYCGSRNAERIMRNIIVLISAAATASMLSNVLFYTVLELSPATAMQRFWLQVSATGFFLTQQGAVSAAVMMMEYTIHRSEKRVRRLGYLLGAVAAVYVLLLAANLCNGFMYHIGPDNVYLRERFYWILPAAAYSAAVIGVVNLLLSYKTVTRHQIKLLLALGVPVIAASAVDILVMGSQIQWPVFCTALLFVYLFLVRFEYGLDSLTGINNRRACDDYLHVLGRSAREPHLFAMIDVDCFKHINDAHGHAQGDTALRDVAVVLKSCIRSTDFLGRYGGDEFLVILRPPAQINNFMARVRKIVAEHNLKTDRPFDLQLSIGCDIYDPAGEETPLRFLEHVDRLMYIDKESHAAARQMKNGEN